jgi:hypothetical protein
MLHYPSWDSPFLSPSTSTLVSILPSNDFRTHAEEFYNQSPPERVPLTDLSVVNNGKDGSSTISGSSEITFNTEVDNHESDPNIFHNASS